MSGPGLRDFFFKEKSRATPGPDLGQMCLKLVRPDGTNPGSLSTEYTGVLPGPVPGGPGGTLMYSFNKEPARRARERRAPVPG